jgi:hypothetical protein
MVGPLRFENETAAADSERLPNCEGLERSVSAAA